MLTTEEWQQKRRLYLMCCMLVVWVVYSFNYSIAVSKMSENHKIDKVFGLIQKQPKVEVEVCHEATVKPLQIGETYYEECELLEEEEIVTEKVEEVEEVEEVEKTEIAEENIETANLVSAETVKSRQNVAEGDTRGTYFLERKPAIEYTDEDLNYLANGIYSEAGICSDMECYRVGQVMLDRMLDQTGRFPQNTIKGILYATGQFGCVGGRAWKHGPTERELEIAKDLLEGARVFPEDIVWFNNKHDYGYLYCKPEYHYFSGYVDHGSGDFASKPDVTMDTFVAEEVVDSTEDIVDEIIVAEVETVPETETIVEGEGVVPEEQLAVAESVVAAEPAASNQEVITEQENTSEEILIALITTK